MSAVQRDLEQNHTARKYRLVALDRSLSLAAFRSIGTHIPRPALMLFEHAGNGLFWLPGTPDTS